MNNRLTDLPLTFGVIPDPLVCPLDGLGPPVGIRVERAEIDIFQSEFGIEISPVGPVIRPVVGLLVEASLATPCYEMVGVQLLDECAHLVDPPGDQFRVTTVRAPGKIALIVRATAGFVG